MPRKPWDAYFLEIAQAVATRATCNRALVGAVLVRDRYILATGYNGAASGMPHCDDAGHLLIDGHCLRAVHAERNALDQARLHGQTPRGATLYVTHLPCVDCSKDLIRYGVARVVYHATYGDADVIVEMLRAGGVAI